MLSRFHWHVTTIWTEPLNEDEKPSVKFTEAIHTPIVKAKSTDCRYIEIEPNLSIKERIEIVNLYLPIFLQILKGVNFLEEDRGYEKILQDGGIPEKYIFKLSEARTAIIVGKFPKPGELPKVLETKIWSE